LQIERLAADSAMNREFHLVHANHFLLCRTHKLSNEGAGLSIMIINKYKQFALVKAQAVLYK
jgi:hypothetical protein